jgi:hypothetical protein
MLTMNRKRFALLLSAILLVLSLSSCTMWSEKKHANWKSATSGENLANLFWSDVKNKQWQSLDGHVAPEFTGIIRTGITDHAQLMEHLRAMDLQEFQIGDLQTKLHGADMVVIYSVTLKGTVNGQPLPSDPIRILSVWQELKHGWVLVAQSAGVS